MVKLALLLFLAGLYLIGSGCYDLFVQAGTSRQQPPSRLRNSKEASLQIGI